MKIVDFVGIVTNPGLRRHQLITQRQARRKRGFTKFAVEGNRQAQIGLWDSS